MQALPVTSPKAPAPRREEGPDPQDGRFGAVMASLLPFQAAPAPPPDSGERARPSGEPPPVREAAAPSENPDATPRAETTRAEAERPAPKGLDRPEAIPDPKATGTREGGSETPAPAPVEKPAVAVPLPVLLPTPMVPIAEPLAGLAQAAPPASPVPPMAQAAALPPAPPPVAPAARTEVAPFEGVAAQTAAPITAKPAPEPAPTPKVPPGAEFTPTAPASPSTQPILPAPATQAGTPPATPPTSQAPLPGAAELLPLKVDSASPAPATPPSPAEPGAIMAPEAEIAPPPTHLRSVVALAVEGAAPKAPPLKATSGEAPLAVSPSAPALPSGASMAGSQSAGQGLGDRSQAQSEAETPRLVAPSGKLANVEGARVPEPAKPFTLETAAPKAEPSRAEAPKADGPKLQPPPGLARDVAAASPTLAPAAQSAVAKPAASPVVNQVEGTLRWMIKGPVPEARLQLHPESLGKVSIELKVEQGQVHAKVWVQEPAAMQALQEGRAALELALKQSGLQLGSFDLQQGGQASRQAPEPQHSPIAAGPKEDPTLRPARQEAPSLGGPSSANPRRIEFYA